MCFIETYLRFLKALLAKVNIFFEDARLPADACRDRKWDRMLIRSKLVNIEKAKGHNKDCFENREYFTVFHSDFLYEIYCVVFSLPDAFIVVI